MSNAALTVVQAGIESTRFTAVAADRVILPKEGIFPNEERFKADITQARGTFNQYYESAETHVAANWQMDQDIAYDTLHWWSQLAMEGNVSPTGVGPYTWAYDSEATADALETATFEFADSVTAFEMNGSAVTEWELSGSDGDGGPGICQATYSLIGQKLTVASITGALTAPDLRAGYMPFKNSTLYLDDTAGGIGGTEVAGAVLSWSIKCNNNIVPIWPGNNSGEMSAYRRGDRHVEFVVELLLDATTLTEFTGHFKANDMRFARLNVPGTGNDDFTFDIAGKWSTHEFTRSGPVRKLALMTRSLYDPTLAYAWKSTVINDESGLT